MRFMPSHLSHGARRNPTKKATAGKTVVRTKTQPTSKKQAQLSPPTRQQVALSFKAQLKDRAKERYAARRKARAAQMGVDVQSPVAAPPASETETTLLTAEEQAMWAQSGLPLPTDAELLSTGDEGELIADEGSVVFTTFPVDPEAEVTAPESESKVGTYALAAVGAAVAAWFAFS